MPTQRNGVWMTDREFPGVGRVARTLGTRSKREADVRESLLLHLPDMGRADLLQAWADGDLHAANIAAAHETGTLDKLRPTSGSSSLKEACERALAHKKPDVAASTYKRYQEGLGHFQRIVGESTPVHVALAADGEEVQAFKLARIEEDAAKATVNNDLAAVSILATYAQKKGWIRERPDINKFDTQVRIRYLTQEEREAYLGAIRDVSRPFMQFLLGSGCRAGEADSLKVSDLKLEGTKGKALIQDAKTARGVRPVYLTPRAVEAAREQIERHDLGRNDELFGERAYWTRYTHHVEACEEVGIQEYTVHDHRHTYAVAMAKAGLPLPDLQRQLGHTTIQMTMRYATFHSSYSDMEQYLETAGV